MFYYFTEFSCSSPYQWQSVTKWVNLPQIYPLRIRAPTLFDLVHKAPVTGFYYVA